MECPDCGAPVPEAESRCPACQAPVKGQPRRAPHGSEPAKDRFPPHTKAANRYFWGFLVALALLTWFLVVVV